MPKTQENILLQNGGKSWSEQLYTLLRWIDSRKLWWTGIIMLAVVMVPHMKLGEGSVFVVHDQLDESMMNYVLTARHPGAGIIPEMLGGINASGLWPSAVLFVPLYMFLPAFSAFMVSYAVMFLCGFLGMYLIVKKLTDSSILAVITGGCFCMLPTYPIYGLSQMGLPLVFYAFLCLREGRGGKESTHFNGLLWTDQSSGVHRIRGSWILDACNHMGTFAQEKKQIYHRRIRGFADDLPNGELSAFFGIGVGTGKLCESPGRTSE